MPHTPLDTAVTRQIELRYYRPIRVVLEDLWRKRGTSKGVALDLGIHRTTAARLLERAGILTRRR